MTVAELTGVVERISSCAGSRDCTRTRLPGSSASAIASPLGASMLCVVAQERLTPRG